MSIVKLAQDLGLSISTVSRALNNYDDVAAETKARVFKRAREIGGDALVLFAPVKSIDAPEGWNLYDTFLYEAVVVAYGE